MKKNTEMSKDRNQMSLKQFFSQKQKNNISKKIEESKPIQVSNKNKGQKQRQKIEVNKQIHLQDISKRRNHRQDISEQRSRSRDQNLQNRSQTSKISSISFKDNLQTELNVKFYLNLIPSQPQGEFIDKIHQTWFSNYEKLQKDHSFIQWIFPNSFQSRFNIYAKPLTQSEVEKFKTDIKIANRYIKSYEMMLGFYGMKIKNRFSGEITRSRINPDYKERFHKTLLTSFHNHMRITRILTSLTETGFGQYAKELCKFLKFQINHPDGGMKSLKKYDVYKEWSPYEYYKQNQMDQNIYLKNQVNKIKKETEKTKNSNNEKQFQEKKQKCQIQDNFGKKKEQ